MKQRSILYIIYKKGEDKVVAKLPREIKLTRHAHMRLEERKNSSIDYNTKNLMKSPCKWYGKDDLIRNSNLYLHCLYVCRKSNQMGYITDGNIEVVYNRNTGVAITVMEVKEKFLPITQYIKPEYLKQIELKKEKKKMKKSKIIIGTCPDCGREEIEMNESAGICDKCRVRKINAKHRGKEYVPYLKLSEAERRKIDTMSRAQEERKKKVEVHQEIPLPKLPVIENYYQMKAKNDPTIAHVVEPKEVKLEEQSFDPLSDQISFINTLRGYGCEIPEETLKDILNVLVSTDKLKDIFMTIARSDSQQAILDLEQALNVVERKLQHDWEYNGFQEVDDIKFKGFLTWRRVLKGAIFFWKKLYQTNALIELQRAWNAYTTDPNDKILLAGDRIDSKQKRYQITTDSISTIFNTRRPFTRVFYATSKEDAYSQFTKWMSDRQLHEDKSKTTIVELTVEGEDGRNQ